MRRVESYLAHVNLAPLVVDRAGNVVGPVLDYNPTPPFRLVFAGRL